MRRVTLLTAVAVLLAVVVVWSAGCGGMSDEEFAAFQDQQAALVGEVTALEGKLDVLNEGRDFLQQQVAEARATAEGAVWNSEAERAAALARIDEMETQALSYDARIGELQAQVGARVDQIEGVSAAISAAETPEDAAAVGLRGAGQAVAPLVGPEIGAGILVVTNLLAGVFSYFGGRRRAARQIVQPIEAARLRGAEDDEAKDLIIIDKKALALAHTATGVTSLIKKLTS